MIGKNQNKSAALFLLPYAVLFLTFIVLPIIYGFYISLHKWYILSPRPDFIGFKNYYDVLQDDLFRIAFVQTLYFILLVVPLGNTLSLLFAIGLNQRFRGTTFYKIAYYLPVVMSVSVVAIVWRWMYSAEFGIINYYLNEAGHFFHKLAPTVFTGKWSLPWLSNGKYAMPAIALLSIWWGAGGNMLIYLAGLKNIPKELMEAADIDGANPIQRFWAVTWPLLKPTTLFCLVISVISSAQVFGQTYIMTGGGPHYSTMTVILYLYQQGFGLYQLGYAAAVGYVLFAAILVFTVLQFKMLGVKQ